MKTQQGFVSAGILIAIVLGLIVVGGGAYFVMQNQSANTEVVRDTGLDQLPTVNTNVDTRPSTPTTNPSTNTSVPTLTFSASPTQINAGDSYTVSWASTNTTSCGISVDGVLSSNESVSGTKNGILYKTTKLDMFCRGPGGSVTKNVTVMVLGSSSNIPIALPAQSSGGIVQIEGPYQGVEGSLHITAVSPNSPATITLWYANLPPRASGLMVCTESGACTEWRESLTPSSQEGAHTINMSVQNALGPNSTKGLSPGRYMIVATGSNFSEQITQSNFFSIKNAQKALGPVSCTLDVKTTSGVGNYQGSGVRYIDIKRGESITVTWNGTNANYAVHQNKEGAVNGTVTLTPTNHESYIWTFYGTGEAGDISCGITVTVNN